jgi:hypothetical protein
MSAVTVRGARLRPTCHTHKWAASHVISSLVLAGALVSGCGIRYPDVNAESLIVRNSGPDSLAFGIMEFESTKRISLYLDPIPNTIILTQAHMGILRPGAADTLMLSVISEFAPGRDLVLNAYEVKGDSSQYVGSVVLPYASFQYRGSVQSIALSPLVNR